MENKDLLADLLQQQQSNTSGNKQKFDKLYGMYLGAPTKEHYPKVKDENGKTLKDSQGKSVVSEEMDGYTYTFSEVGTSKILKVVYLPGLLITPGVIYRLSGLGYDMRSSSMIFLDEDTLIEEMEAER
ncbi:hypothetical protein [Streptococcus sp. A22]|uniref:hypothetical protein n=1 Tax=Streptococcus sp. A22 TaxID=3373126 RepID=UPI00374CD713